MKFNGKFLVKLALVIGAWGLCSFMYYQNADRDNISKDILQLFCILLAAGVTVFAFASNLDKYSKTRRRSSFIPSLAAAAGLACFLCIIALLKLRDRSPTVLEASRHTSKFDLSGVSLELREDNTYKISRHNIMSTRYSRGSYSQRDSLIVLDCDDALRGVRTRRFLLRFIPGDTLPPGKGILGLLVHPRRRIVADALHLYPVDEQNRILDSSEYFAVVRTDSVDYQ